VYEKCKIIMHLLKGADIDRPALDKWLTLDSLCQIGFRRTLNLLEKPHNRFVIDALHSFSSVMGVYVQFPELAKLHLEKLVQWLPRAKATHTKLTILSNKFGSSVVEARNDHQRCLFSRILSSADQRVQHTFPESELWAEGIFLMLAGELTQRVAGVTSSMND